MDYLNFDLQISLDSQGAAVVTVVSSPAGEAQAYLSLADEHFPTPGGVADLRDLGTHFFDVLLAGDVRNRYDVSRQIALEENKGLRLRLRIAAYPALSMLNALPWECLYDARAAEFVALSRQTPLVRYVQTSQPSQARPVEGPIRLLGVIALPHEIAPLDVARERQWMTHALEELTKEGRIELHWLENATWRTLQAVMQRGPWHIIHFIGHGYLDEETGDSGLLLADDDGQPYPLSAANLDTLLSDQPQLRLAVLNACHGAESRGTGSLPSMATFLVERGTSAVLAMQDAISDRAAVEFGRSLYSALAAGLPVDAAAAEARKAIGLIDPDTTEWVTLVLYMRTPDGVLWQIDDKGKATDGPISRLPAPLLYVLVTGVIIGALSLIWVGVSTAGIWNAVAAPPTATATRTPTPMPTPTATPITMQGTQLNVAIAQFGLVDAAGTVTSSALGSALSRTVFEQIRAEYLQYPDLVDEIEEGVWLWHDSMEPGIKNIDFGVMMGEDETERAASAAALASRIHADMVVYGNLLVDEDPNSLVMEFYYSSPTLLDDFGASLGTHRFGAGIPSQASFIEDETVARLSLRKPLAERATSLFWLTVALTHDVLGDYTESAKILQQVAEQQDSTDETQRNEVIYYFLGRARLRLRQHDAAIAALEEAIRLRPDYTSAHIALGGVYFDRAQLFFAPNYDELPQDVRSCIPSELSELSITSLDDALIDVDRAIEQMQRADELAGNDPWPAIQIRARLALGMSYQLKGRALLSRGNEQATSGDTVAADASYAQVNEFMTRARNLLEESASLARARKEYEYLGWSHMTLGAIALIEGSYTNQARVDAANHGNEELAATMTARAHQQFQTAAAHFQTCIDQHAVTQTNAYFQKYILNCGCVAYQNVVNDLLQDLGE